MVEFVDYTPDAREACLAIFDRNCPEFFAPNERPDYADFLRRADDGYRLCRIDGRVVGAFGLMAAGAPGDAHLNWILISPDAQGGGIGRAIIAEVAASAREREVRTVHIAASHRSAPFFARFGAEETGRKDDGWGPGMHRVDMVWRLDV